MRFFGWPWAFRQWTQVCDRRKAVEDLNFLLSLSYLQLIVSIGAELRRQGYAVELRNAQNKKGAVFLAKNSSSKLALRYVHFSDSSVLDEQSMRCFMNELQLHEDTKVMIATRECARSESFEIAAKLGLQFVDGFHLLDLLRERGIPNDEQWRCPCCGGMRYLKNNCADSGFLALVCPNRRIKRCDVNPVWMNVPGPHGEFAISADELPRMG